MNDKGQQILIVDDNVMNLQVTAKFLKEEGFRISLALDGQSALNLLQTQIPELIILDIMMPGMDGLELCRRIKKIEKLKEIPVIFLTAKNQTEDLVEGFKAGGVDYVTKPFERAELLIRVQNHLELAGSRKKIIEMNKTRDKLYSILAHDIRSPLSNISMMVSALMEHLIDPTSSEFTEIITDISNGTKNTLTLLQNLLTWTKIQSETIAVEPKQNSLFSVVSECVQFLSTNAKNKKISIEINLSEDCEAYFDEVTMHTVIRNLLSNAIKFTPENGKIEISAQLVENYMEISLKDTGKGMTENIINRIFVENEHFTSRGTNDETGTGLGLYMVKDFVKKNGGQIRVNSIVGTGTEFIISLPASQLIE